MPARIGAGQSATSPTLTRPWDSTPVDRNTAEHAPDDLWNMRMVGLTRGQADWRDDPRLRRLFLLATFGWSAVFAIRAGVQALLYREDLPGLLAVGKVLLGWPLTLAAVALTLAAVRRATRRSTAG